jgi:succinate dehydrogenase/fumarate reductase flavoprotein subunit
MPEPEPAVQSGGRAFLILDHGLYTSRLPEGYVVREKFDLAWQAGRSVVNGSTLAELADRMVDRPENALWGVDRSRFLTTMAEYNRAAAADRAHTLPVPRRRHVRPLDHPPYYAMAVRAGITFTLGGIDVDTSCQAIGTEAVPIHGLYVAGADAGGTYHNGYMGGLALGLVQGRIAGREAARLAIG